MAAVRWPAWVRRAHPIVQQETRYWSHSRAWRAARRLLLGGALLLILVPAGGGLLFSLSSRGESSPAAILWLGGVFAVGLALLTGLAVWFVNLSATILGSTLIARERESQTWPFLRLTNLTARDIVGGKLMALFYTLIGPAELITGLRLLALAAGVVTLVLAYAASGSDQRDLAQLFGPFLAEFSLDPAQWLGVVGFGALTLLWIVLTWLAEPLFGLLYYGVIGLAASTLVRSRGAAIVLAFGVHFCLALGLYLPASQLNSLFFLPLAAAGNQQALLPFAVLAVGVQFAIQNLLPWVIVIVCVWMALQRVEVLSD